MNFCFIFQLLVTWLIPPLFFPFVFVLLLRLLVCRCLCCCKNPPGSGRNRPVHPWCAWLTWLWGKIVPIKSGKIVLDAESLAAITAAVNSACAQQLRQMQSRMPQNPSISIENESRVPDPSASSSTQGGRKKLKVDTTVTRDRTEDASNAIGLAGMDERGVIES